MNDLMIDARRWRFLDNPTRYIEHETGGLQIEPLTRQFKTAKEILTRLTDGRGVLLGRRRGARQDNRGCARGVGRRMPG